MARPQTKSELIEAATASFGKLQAMLGEMSPEQLLAHFAFDDRDRCVRDVLVHLHQWHGLLLNWANTNLAGGSAPFLPDGYTWKTYLAMNVEIRDRHLETSVEDARRMLGASHAEVLALIATQTDEQLFTKRHYPWTGTTSLGSYCVSATSSHYEWALKKLRKHLRS